MATIIITLTTAQPGTTVDMGFASPGWNNSSGFTGTGTWISEASVGLEGYIPLISSLDVGVITAATCAVNYTSSTTTGTNSNFTGLRFFVSSGVGFTGDYGISNTVLPNSSGTTTFNLTALINSQLTNLSGLFVEYSVGVTTPTFVASYTTSNADGGSLTITSIVITLTYTAVTVTGILPNHGVAGTLVNITGTGFNAIATIPGRSFPFTQEILQSQSSPFNLTFGVFDTTFIDDTHVGFVIPVAPNGIPELTDVRIDSHNPFTIVHGGVSQGLYELNGGFRYEIALPLDAFTISPAVGSVDGGD